MLSRSPVKVAVAVPVTLSTVTAANHFVQPSEPVNWKETPDARVVEKS